MPCHRNDRGFKCLAAAFIKLWMSLDLSQMSDISRGEDCSGSWHNYVSCSVHCHWHDIWFKIVICTLLQKREHLDRRHFIDVMFSSYVLSLVWQVSPTSGSITISVAQSIPRSSHNGDYMKNISYQELRLIADACPVLDLGHDRVAVLVQALQLTLRSCIVLRLKVLQWSTSIICGLSQHRVASKSWINCCKIYESSISLSVPSPCHSTRHT